MREKLSFILLESVADNSLEKGPEKVGFRAVLILAQANLDYSRSI